MYKLYSGISADTRQNSGALFVNKLNNCVNATQTTSWWDADVEKTGP